MLFLAKGVEGKICPEADPFSIGFTAVFMLFVVCDLCVSFPPLNTQIISLFLHIFAHSHKLPWALRHPLPKELEIPMFRERFLLQIGCSGGKKNVFLGNPTFTREIMLFSQSQSMKNSCTLACTFPAGIKVI